MVTPKTHVFILLDRSYSMECIKNEIIRDFNEQAQTIKDRAEDIDTKVTYVTFNHEVNFEFIGEKAENLNDINPATYTPRGGTALYDAIGATIERGKKEVDEDTAVLFIIVSDGEDLNSNMYTQTQIAEMIQTMTDSYSWTFTYVGCDHDVTKVTQNLNIPASNVMQVSKSSRGINIGSQVKFGAYNSYVDKVVQTSATVGEGESLQSVMNNSADSAQCFYNSTDEVLNLEDGNEAVTILTTGSLGVSDEPPKKKRKKK